MPRYKKELASKPLLLGNGKSLHFDHVVDDIGILALDETKDAALIAELNEVVGSAGVSVISEAAYEELKKKEPLPARATQSRGIRLFAPPKDPWGGQKGEQEAVQPQVPKMVPTLANVPTATARENAEAAGVQKHVVLATVEVPSAKFKPKTKAVPRRGAAKKEKSE